MRRRLGGVDCGQQLVLLSDCIPSQFEIPLGGQVSPESHIDSNVDDNITCSGRGQCNPTNGHCFCDPFVGGYLCAGGDGAEDVDAPGTCNDGLDNDRDGSFDCMDRGCEGHADCEFCLVTLGGCNAGKHVGDPCSIEDDNVTIPGVCYGGAARDDDGLPCAGDCVCRVAIGIVDTSQGEAYTDLAADFPLDFAGCPCFDHDQLFDLWTADDVAFECETSGSTQSDGCYDHAPRWANPKGLAVLNDPTRSLMCGFESKDSTLEIRLSTTGNYCQFYDYNQLRATGRVVSLTEAQEAACVAILEPWRTDVDQDGVPDAIDPLALPRCPGETPCNGRGRCNPVTGACLCDPGVRGLSCAEDETQQGSCTYDWDCQSPYVCNEDVGVCVLAEQACDNLVDDDGDGHTDCDDAACRESTQCAFCGMSECNDGGKVGDSCTFMPAIWSMVVAMAGDTGELPPEAFEELLDDNITGRCYGGAETPEGTTCQGECACVGGSQWNLIVVGQGENDCEVPWDGNFDDGGGGGTDSRSEAPERCGGGPLLDNEGYCDCGPDTGCSCVGVIQSPLTNDFDDTCPCFDREDLVRILGGLASACADAPFPSSPCFPAHRMHHPWITPSDGGLDVGTTGGVAPPLWGEMLAEGVVPQHNALACMTLDIPGLSIEDLLGADGQTPPDLTQIQILLDLLLMAPSENLCFEMNLDVDVQDIDAPDEVLIDVGFRMRRTTERQELACRDLIDDCVAYRPDGSVIIKDFNHNGEADCVEVPPDFVTECEGVDNCPVLANFDQLNQDYDLLGDVCDACHLDPDNDHDGDGVCGNDDNCPDDNNTVQANFDGDEFGDACDPDDDNDGDDDNETCAVASDCDCRPVRRSDPSRRGRDLRRAGQRLRRPHRRGRPGPRARPLRGPGRRLHERVTGPELVRRRRLRGVYARQRRAVGAWLRAPRHELQRRRQRLRR